MVAGKRTTSEVDAAPALPVDPASEAPRRTRAALPLPLALVTLGLTYWCVDIVSPALPAVRDALALSGTGAGLVFACFFAGRLVTNLPASLLVDRLGPPRTAALGAALLLLGSGLAASAGGEAALFPARAIQGVGVAFLVTAGLLSVLRARPGGGAAMTAFNLAAGLGGSAGLISGGWLTATFGWRAVFALSTGLGGVLLAGALAQRPGPSREKSRHVPPDEVDAEAAPGSVRRVALVGALLANLLVYGNYSVWVVSLALYTSERFGVDAAGLGVLLLTINVVHLTATVPAGRVIRRVGARRALAGGFALSATGLVLVLAVPDRGWLVAPMVLYAVGQVTANSAAGDLLLRLGGGGGKAVGLVRLTTDVGLVVGPAAVGVLADVAGVAAPFPVLAALTALGAVVAGRGALPARRG